MLGSIADSWDAIVEAALWFQENSSDMGQYSSTTSTTSLITDDSTDEEDQLDTFLRLCRCITGHAPLGAYCQRFNISGNVHCPCRVRHGVLETRSHALHSCP
jgi:hypothetical protein